MNQVSECMEKITINDAQGMLPPEIGVCLGNVIACVVQSAMKDPANRASFEKWYFQKYGRSYVWKHTCIKEE